jgi:hypothetical protein
MGTLRENKYTFFIISRSVLLKMRNVSDTICRESLITHFMFNNVFFSKIMPFMRYVKKYFRPRHAAHDHVA